MKKSLIRLFVLLLLIVTLLGITQFPKLKIGTGYAAKMACSCVFLQGRDIEEVKKDQLYFSVLPQVSVEVDQKNRLVNTSIFGLSGKTAVYKPGLGCILLHGEDNHQVSAPSSKLLNSRFDFEQGRPLAKASKLDQYLEADDQTHSLLIIQNDSVRYEYYAPAFNKSTPLLGWSMSKSVIGALIGTKVDQGVLDINDTKLFDHWTDERSDITLHHLLQMTSGLDWEEDYSKVSSATSMLYDTDDIVSAASAPKLREPVGTQWMYSSGTTNLLSGILRSSCGSDDEYHNYPRTALFDKLGMSTAVMECDESGNFVGSSYMWASARDWAKFGRMYMDNGLAPDSTRVLSEDWIRYSTLANKQSKGKYGTQFWFDTYHEEYPSIKQHVFSANGYAGQQLFLLPDLDAIVVRTGSKDMEFDHLLSDVISIL